MTVPDFDRLARKLAEILVADELCDDDVALARTFLRQVWSARGAADIAAVEHLPKVMDDATDAIRSLDAGDPSAGVTTSEPRADTVGTLGPWSLTVDE